MTRTRPQFTREEIERARRTYNNRHEVNFGGRTFKMDDEARGIFTRALDAARDHFAETGEKDMSAIFAVLFLGQERGQIERVA